MHENKGLESRILTTKQTLSSGHLVSKIEIVTISRI